MIYLGFTLIILGIIIIICGIIGLFRFPDFFTKLHAASVIDCCGMPISLIGLAFLQSASTATVKLIIMAIIIFILNPISTYAIGKAALPYKTDASGGIIK